MSGRSLLNLTLAMTLVLAVYGAVWISDDFDHLRFVVLTYAGVPVTAAYFMLEWLYPKWEKRFKPARLGAIAIMTFAFTTGILGLVNAVTAEGPVVKRNFGSDRYTTSDRNYQRGGLGELFQRRW